MSFDGNKVRIYTLNAAADSKNKREINNLKSALDADLKDYEGNRQADGFSCPIFALQDLNALSNMTNAEKDRSLGRSYQDLDPRFLRHTQRLTIFENGYPNKDAAASKKGISLKDYIGELVFVNYGEKDQARNYNITDKVSKYVMAVKDQYLEKIKNNSPEIEEIIKFRTDFKGKNTFYKSGFVIELIQKAALDAALGKENNLERLINKFLDEKSKVKVANLAIKRFIKLGNGRSIAEIIKSFPAEKRKEYFAEVAKEALVSFEASGREQKSNAVLGAFSDLSERDAIINSSLLKPFVPMVKIKLLGKKLSRYISGEYEVATPIVKNEQKTKLSKL